MKARYVQRGESIDYTPESAVAAGDIVKLGALTGVAKLDIKPGELGALALVGVYEIEKGDTVVAAGDLVSVDPVTGKLVKADAEGAVRFGHAIEAAPANVLSVLVRLEQGL